MSNRDPDARYEKAEQSIPWMIEQWCRHNLHTCLPGLVLSYNSTSKRARVQPGLRTRLAPVEDDPRTLEDKPPILNVPLRQTATGGHMVHQAIHNGDTVLLMFSERGLDQFKERWSTWQNGAASELTNPAKGAFFEMRDAFALPWGVETIAPVYDSGWIVQSQDGRAYIRLDGDRIELVTGSSRIVMLPNDIEIRSPHIGEND